MASDKTDIVVLSPGIHGMPIDQLAEALKQRLPDLEIVVAYTETEKQQYLSTARFATGTNIDPNYVHDANNLSLFACTYAGTDHVPVEILSKAGVYVTNASGVHGPNVSEYVIGAILLFTNGFTEAYRRQRNKEWRHFQTDEMFGSTATVIGLGAIGTAILKRLDGFGVETIGVRNSPEKDGPAGTVIGYDRNAIHSALARSDVVILSCPLTSKTRHLIDHTALLTMDPNALLINVARGPVVDTAALVTCLQQNQIGGAVLDVTDPEPLPATHQLWTLDNVIITPHNAGHTPQYYPRLADIISENVTRLDRGQTPLKNQVIR